MNPFITLLYAASAAIVLVSAAPSVEAPPVLTIKKRQPTEGKRSTAKEIVKRDLARIASRNARTHGLSKRIFSTAIINEDVTYVVPVGLCGLTYNLAVVTGSDDTTVRLRSPE